MERLVGGWVISDFFQKQYSGRNNNLRHCGQTSITQCHLHLVMVTNENKTSVLHFKTDQTVHVVQIFQEQLSIYFFVCIARHSDLFNVRYTGKYTTFMCVLYSVFSSRQMMPPRQTASHQHRLYLKAQTARSSPRDFMFPTSPSGLETQTSGKCLA